VWGGDEQVVTVVGQPQHTLRVHRTGPQRLDFVVDLPQAA